MVENVSPAKAISNGSLHDRYHEQSSEESEKEPESVGSASSEVIRVEYDHSKVSGPRDWERLEHALTKKIRKTIIIARG